jgi:hypothetical protein
MAIGHMVLHLLPSIQQHVEPAFSAEQLWDWLVDTYDKDTVSSVYKDLHKVLNTHFLPDQHPTTVFEKLEAAYWCLNDVEISGKAGNLKI